MREFFEPVLWLLAIAASAFLVYEVDSWIEWERERRREDVLRARAVARYGRKW